MESSLGATHLDECVAHMVVIATVLEYKACLLIEEGFIVETEVLFEQVLVEQCDTFHTVKQLFNTACTVDAVDAVDNGAL